MLLALLVGVVGGALVPVQTVVNTRLAGTLRATWLASGISFLVGTVFLAAVVLASRPALAGAAALRGQPWWIWTGGACGVAFLTLNMVLMRNLGASVTVVMPILGQVLGGLTIDTLGLFQVARHPLTAARVLGTLLVLVGAVVVNLGRSPAGLSGPRPATRRLLMVLGVLGGALSATQTTVNGRLGGVLGSPVAASLVSFAVGLACLVVVNLVVRPAVDVARVRAARPPWWVWSGGVLGAVFVVCTAADAPILGTSLTVSVVLLGQIASGLAVDHFGVLGAARRPVTVRKVVGAAVVLAGIAAVRLL